MSLDNKLLEENKLLKAENEYMKDLLELYGGCYVCKHYKGALKGCELGGCDGRTPRSKWVLKEKENKGS